MDKFTNSTWFFKGISLLLAILLYISISVDGQVSKQEVAGFLGSDVTEKISDVKVHALYDYDNLSVSGIPEGVDITLGGTNSIVKSAILEKNYEVYVDLSDLPLGTHTVPLKYRNVSDKLKVKIKPSEIKVTIQEKVTKNFPIEVQYINKDKMAKGYKLEEPLIKPNKVSVTGPKDTIDSIHSIKAFVDLDGVNQTFTKNAVVRAYTSNGEEVPIEIQPATVSVTIPVVTPSKVVSIDVKQKGTLKDNLELVSVEIDPKNVTIFGPLDKIDAIHSINDLEIDLGSITESTVIERDVPLINGIQKALPDKITIRVNVKQMEQKEISNIPIQFTGLRDGYSGKFTTPTDGKVKVSVYGEKERVNRLTTSDFTITVNASSLSEGSHQVPLTIKGPDGVQITSDLTEATIDIQKGNNVTTE